jgi:hypothetical protein
MARLADLTAEEVLRIPNHCKFWRERFTSKAPIDRNEFQAAIEIIYKILGLKIPNLHFCRSPHELIEKSRDFFQRAYHCEDGMAFPSQTMAKIHELHVSFVCAIGGHESLLGNKLSVISSEELEVEYRIYDEFRNLFRSSLLNGFDSYEVGCISWFYPCSGEIDEVCWIDFHFSVMRHTISEDADDIAWQAYRKLIQLGGWFISFESDCFVYDRPQYIV